MQRDDAPSARFLQLIVRALRDGQLVRVVFSAPSKDGGALGPGLRRSVARRVQLKRGPALSLVHSYATRDDTKNFDLDEAEVILGTLLGAPYTIATALTTHDEHELRLRKDGPWRLTRRSLATPRATPSDAHDHDKARLLGDHAHAYLEPLRIVDATGKVRAGLEHKHRQIHRYVEILDALVRRLAWPKDQPLHIVDMGAGKGYLTFALYDHLTRGMGLRAQIIGVEARPELVAEAAALAQRIGFDGLRFQQALAADADLGALDVLIALHACDTATDDALYRGLAARAQLIVTAPCCHKELRPQLHARDAGLEALLSHGILAARQADLVTDEVRALCLEHSGYGTDVFEFVDAEHTAKNLMIAALREKRADLPREEDQRAANARMRLGALRALFGWRTQHLQEKLGLV